MQIVFSQLYGLRRRFLLALRAFTSTVTTASGALDLFRLAVREDRAELIKDLTAKWLDDTQSLNSEALLLCRDLEERGGALKWSPTRNNSPRSRLALLAKCHLFLRHDPRCWLPESLLVFDFLPSTPPGGIVRAGPAVIDGLRHDDWLIAGGKLGFCQLLNAPVFLIAFVWATARLKNWWTDQWAVRAEDGLLAKPGSQGLWRNFCKCDNYKPE